MRDLVQETSARRVNQRFWYRNATRRTLQGLLLALAAAMVIHGFTGSQLAPRNLATLLTWVHYRGLLLLVLLAAGNFFCMSCPMILARDLLRKIHVPTKIWPAALRNKWMAIVLFVAVLFFYEYLDLWGNPAYTAGLIVVYFGGALLVDGLFKGASFCKYVCPVGQFNFLTSTISPLEVSVLDPATCATCTTLDCIRGSRSQHDPELVLRRGCELALFQPAKVGNLDCTFCMDCVRACPHDNVALQTRLPGAELWNDGRRSGIGRLSGRKDFEALFLLFTFGALLNAFAMVSPVYAFQAWISGWLETTNDLAILSGLFTAALIVEPVVLLGLAGTLSRYGTAPRIAILETIRHFAPSLLPLGIGIWAAHYSFHLLTGIWTFIPVIQSLLGLVPGPLPFGMGVAAAYVLPLEMGFLLLGAFLSLGVAWQTAERLGGRRPWRVLFPWVLLILIMLAAAVWLLLQPMEMRGTFLGG